ncbi:MAG: APC family permease, partial [Candidatus Micrarchaeaceae archaeon]
MAEDAQISVPVATAVGLGAIIGAGIFVLSGTALALAGPMALAAFILVGIVALLVAFEMGELSSIMPHAKGAAYSYVFKAFGSEMGFITGILLYFSFASAIPVVALGFGSYLSSMLGLSGSLVIPFAILLILAVTFVNLVGIKKAAKADSALVIIKVAILCIFIAFAIIFAIGHQSSISSNFAAEPSKGSIAAVFAASVAIFFAFSGFQTISTFTSRIRGGGAAAAKAVIGSVLVSMALYILVVLGLVFLAPASSYGITGDPLSFALNSSHAPRYLFYVIDLGALMATASATLAMMLSSSRIMYQIGEDRLLPSVTRKYNPK